ncbi:MAG: hypothetical protein BAA01_09490 [Bacillus thermozeamaize]|uniref:Phage head-tail adapter protein n=1 Tax=Bacillus thermozeamaize TaxID=230954 RepID=A0A1Y3PEB9_9BACI|nr:MAG: hypothetical protein BAA01_09490 [Bacillus thermozeamaize]
MRHDQVIYLLSVTVEEDEIGNQIETITERMVFANELAVTSEEFYNAAATGLRPAKRFEVYSFEYQGEDRLRHDSVVYRIIRAETRGEKTRITCEKVVADD